MRPTPKMFLSKKIVAAVNNYRSAVAAQRAVESKMWPLYDAVVAAGEYFDDKGNKITEHKYAWLIEDEAASSALYAKFDEVRKEQGYDLAPGYCPALIAQSKTMGAFKDMADAIEPLVGITHRSLITSTGAIRAEYVRIVFGLVDSASKIAA